MNPLSISDSLYCSLAWTLVAVSASVAAPSFSGNTNIASQIKEGDARVLLLGDSLQNLTQGEYLRRWPVQKFVGHFVGENVGMGTGGFTWGFSHPWIGAHDARLPDDPPAPNGYTGIAPGAVYHAQFNAQPVAPDDNVFSNRVYATHLSRDQAVNYHGGTWAHIDGKPMSVDLLVYANPQGLVSGLTLDVLGNSLTTPLASTSISSYAETAELRRYTLNFNAVDLDSGRELSAAIRMKAGSTPEQDSNLIVVGSRFYTGETGFQMTNIAWGGKRIEYYTNPAHTTEENLSRFLQYTESNIALIQMGANGAGETDKQQYKSQMLELVARYKQASPAMQFALVSNFDLGLPVYSDYADALHEIALDDPSVLFLNLFDAAGSFEVLNEHYLSDGIHPSFVGARYMADTLWGLIDAAAVSNVPEPSVISVMTVGGIFLLKRRPRRED